MKPLAWLVESKLLVVELTSKEIKMPDTKKMEKKVAKVMREYSKGTLKSGSGKKVTTPAQAKAIAMSEGRKAGGY